MNKKTNIYASTHRHKFSQFLFGCLHSYKPIVDYIDTQFENYLQEELKIKRSLFNYHDTRIHICLYFIAPTGHSLKSLDLVTMKKLDSKVNTKTHIHSHTCKLWSHTPSSFLIVCEKLSAWLKSDLPLTERCVFHWDVEIPDLLAGVWTVCPTRIKQRLALSANISEWRISRKVHVAFFGIELFSFCSGKGWDFSLRVYRSAVHQSIVSFRPTLTCGFFIALVRVLLLDLLVSGLMFCHTSDECGSVQKQSLARPQLDNGWKKISSQQHSEREDGEGREFKRSRWSLSLIILVFFYSIQRNQIDEQMYNKFYHTFLHNCSVMNTTETKQSVFFNLKSWFQSWEVWNFRRGRDPRNVSKYMFTKPWREEMMFKMWNDVKISFFCVCLIDLKVWRCHWCLEYLHTYKLRKLHVAKMPKCHKCLWLKGVKRCVCFLLHPVTTPWSSFILKVSVISHIDPWGTSTYKYCQHCCSFGHACVWWCNNNELRTKQMVSLWPKPAGLPLPAINARLWTAARSADTRPDTVEGQLSVVTSETLSLSLWFTNSGK